jgi:putative transposase
LKGTSKKIHRKSIRLSEYDYSFPNWYYITVCTYERRNLLGEIKNGETILNKIGQVVEKEWIRTKEIRKYVELDYYVIMPNHLHGIIIIEQSIENGRGELNSPAKDESGRIQYAPKKNKFISPSLTLGAIVRGFKSSVTKKIKELSGHSESKIWQRNYYEHIIRNELDLQNIRQYITLNPFKWEIDEYFKSHNGE